MKEKEVLVKVEGLSKKFCKDLKLSLWYGLKDLFSNLKGNNLERNLREQEFWAVKDINFELRRGECLGLIGHNGAGKSTLLKILNGLIKPDEGKVTIRGRVGALIELGAGFNPILTGRENIYNNGAILGFSRKEINDKLEEIIDFAEIREFIDMPVRNYSSGMKVRLGFAIAAQMEPDVLIIDEVLAVGDLGFVLKCFKTIDHLLPKTAIVFVSHSMPMVSRICTYVSLLENGKSKYFGKDVAKGIDLYYSRFNTTSTEEIFNDGKIELEKVQQLKVMEFLDGIPQLDWGQDLCLSFDFRIQVEMNVIPEFIITIFDKEQRPVARLRTNELLKECRKEKGDLISFEVSHRNLQLSKGIYTINVSVYNPKSAYSLLRINNIHTFQIRYKKEVWEPFMLDSSFRFFSKEKSSDK